MRGMQLQACKACSPARAEDQLCKAAYGFWPNVTKSLSPSFPIQHNKIGPMSCFPLFIRSLWNMTFPVYLLGKKNTLYASVASRNDIWCQPTSLRFAGAAVSSQPLFWRTPLSSSSPVTCMVQSYIPLVRFPVWRRGITKPFTASSVVTSPAQRKQYTPVTGDDWAAWGARGPIRAATMIDSLLKHHLPMNHIHHQSYHFDQTKSHYTKIYREAKEQTELIHGHVMVQSLRTHTRNLIGCIRRGIIQSPSWPRKNNENLSK